MNPLLFLKNPLFMMIGAALLQVWQTTNNVEPIPVPIVPVAIPGPGLIDRVGRLVPFFPFLGPVRNLVFNVGRNALSVFRRRPPGPENLVGEVVDGVVEGAVEGVVEGVAAVVQIPTPFWHWLVSGGISSGLTALMAVGVRCLPFFNKGKKWQGTILPILKPENLVPLSMWFNIHPLLLVTATVFTTGGICWVIFKKDGLIAEKPEDKTSFLNSHPLTSSAEKLELIPEEKAPLTKVALEGILMAYNLGLKNKPKVLKSKPKDEAIDIISEVVEGLKKEKKDKKQNNGRIS